MTLDHPIDGEWYWVRLRGGTDYFPATYDKGLPSKWWTNNDCWEDFNREVEEFIHIPPPDAISANRTDKVRHMTYKSTTHREEFFHITLPPKKTYSHITVFCREEGQQDTGEACWYASWAACSGNDTFARSRGRTIARRHYFNYSRHLNIGTQPPNYARIRELVDVFLPSLPNGYASLVTTIGARAVGETWDAFTGGK